LYLRSLGKSATEAHLRSILATVPDALIIIDENGVILSFSPAAEKMFGYAEDEVAGENVSMLMPSPDRERHDGYLSSYRESGVRKIIGIGRVTTARRRDGSTFPIELSVGEAWVDSKRVFTGFIHDISGQQQADQRFHELQSELAHVGRLNELGTLASSLAHELNQPLTAITSYCQGAADLLDDEQDAQRRESGRHGVALRRCPHRLRGHGQEQRHRRARAALAADRRGAARLHGEDAAPPFTSSGTLLVVQIDYKDIAAGAAGQDSHVVAGRVFASGTVPACKNRIGNETFLKLSPFRQLGALP